MKKSGEQAHEYSHGETQWDRLRREILAVGISNSRVMAIAPLRSPPRVMRDFCDSIEPCFGMHGEQLKAIIPNSEQDLSVRQVLLKSAYYTP